MAESASKGSAPKPLFTSADGRSLYRSRTNRMICGVCGGLADYLKVDATIVRLIWAFVALFAGTGILLYIVACLIIPEEPAK